MSYIYNLTDTWNDAGVTFTSIKMNVTATAYGTGSKLMDLQVSGTSKVSASFQGISDYNPGSGVVEVRDGLNPSGYAQFTRYQYGTTIRTYGTNSQMLELFLGDGTGGGGSVFSVRNNGALVGSQIQCRNQADTNAVLLDFVGAYGIMGLENNASAPNQLSIQSPAVAGFITFDVAGAEKGRFTAGGMLTFGGIAAGNVALKPNSTTLEARLGNDSDYADFKAGLITTNTGFDASGNSLQKVDLIYFNSANNTILRSDAANELTLRNGTANQTFKIYETYTDASNNSGLAVYYDGSGNWRIWNQRFGTGSGRQINIGGEASRLLFSNDGGVERWRINTITGYFQPSADNTYDIGDPAGNFMRRVNAYTVTHKGVAFASLPASPVAGMTAYVTDSNTTTWGATIAGGSTNKVLAFYNGTNWTVSGI